MAREDRKPSAATETTPGRGPIGLLWASWLLGPLGWALHQSASFALTDWVCRTGNVFVLHILSVVALAIVLAGGAAAWRGYRASRREEAGSGRLLARSRFMATVGAMICLVSFGGVVMESVPNFVLDACAGAS